MELEYSRYDFMYIIKSFDSYHKSGRQAIFILKKDIMAC